MDLDHDRHFKGKLASVTIADKAMTAAQIACVFTANNGLLPALPRCNAMIAEMMMVRPPPPPLPPRFSKLSDTSCASACGWMPGRQTCPASP